MSRKDIANANIILDRLREAYNFPSDVKLASFLHVGASTVASWRRRDSMKLRQIIEFASDLNLNWLFYGELPVWKKHLPVGDDNTNYEAFSDRQDDENKYFIKKITSLNVPAEKRFELLRAYLELLDEVN